MLLRARRFADRPMAVVLILVLAAALAAGAAARAGAANRAGGATGPRTSQPKVTAPTAVPQGFVGVDVDGPMLGPDTTVDFGDQLKTMVTNGVQSVRAAFSWAAAQPYKTDADVPADRTSQFTDVGGVPTSFQVTDMIVGDAARERLTVLPTVLYAPEWDGVDNPNGVDTPRRSGPYAAYLTALIGRYGPRGSFWRANPGIPKMPIRSWQVWNEPNLSYYWKQPFASTYVSFLRTAHAAIKKADPGAKVVLGALTNTAWKSLGQIYRIKGARSLFDVVAVNGFTKIPAHVMLFMLFVRHAMARFGDNDKPLLATEISWPSAKGHTHDRFDFITTQAGQARNIATLLPLIGQQRLALHLIGFYWYTWMGEESANSTAFNFSGLLGFNHNKVTVKPALAAFRAGALALEGCKRKGLLATSCIR
jgi:polysaccharide biosynthesis protein PslG